MCHHVCRYHPCTASTEADRIICSVGQTACEFLLHTTIRLSSILISTALYHTTIRCKPFFVILILLHGYFKQKMEKKKLLL